MIKDTRSVRNSCGALFYTYNDKNELGIILGKERNNYTPCKGRMEPGEIAEESAIREIAEESNNMIILDELDLYFASGSSKKTHFLGLCYVPFTFIEQYNSSSKRIKEAEKDNFRFFRVDDILSYRYDVRLVPRYVVDATRFYESYMMYNEDRDSIAIIEILQLRKYNQVEYA
jgi:ADP-ribose pyrophosphatase YjhB (NUDIX family)